MHISIFGQSYGPVSSPNASDEDANLPINAKVKNKRNSTVKLNEFSLRYLNQLKWEKGFIYKDCSPEWRLLVVLLNQLKTINEDYYPQFVSLLLLFV